MIYLRFRKPTNTDHWLKKKPKDIIFGWSTSKWDRCMIYHNAKMFEQAKCLLKFKESLGSTYVWNNFLYFFSNLGQLMSKLRAKYSVNWLESLYVNRAQIFFVCPYYHHHYIEDYKRKTEAINFNFIYNQSTEVLRELILSFIIYIKIN